MDKQTPSNRWQEFLNTLSSDEKFRNDFLAWVKSEMEMRLQTQGWKELAQKAGGGVKPGNLRKAYERESVGHDALVCLANIFGFSDRAAMAAHALDELTPPIRLVPANFIRIADWLTPMFLIEGDLVRPIPAGRIYFKPLNRTTKLILPALAGRSKQIAEEIAETNEYRGRTNVRNGPMVCIERYIPQRVGKLELQTLLIEYSETRYSAFLAVMEAFRDHFQTYSTPNPLLDTELHLRNHDWQIAPKGLLVGCALNLVAISGRDRKLIMTKRSTTVAVGAGEIAVAVNENILPGETTEQLCGRACPEELGLSGTVDILGMTVDVVHPLAGLYGCVEFRSSQASEVINAYVHAKDKEIASFIVYDWNVRSVGNLICELMQGNNPNYAVATMLYFAAIYKMKTKSQLDAFIIRRRAEEPPKRRAKDETGIWWWLT